MKITIYLRYESVSEDLPDKFADRISDMIVDYIYPKIQYLEGWKY